VRIVTRTPGGVNGARPGHETRENPEASPRRARLPRGRFRRRIAA
jgi:hypothetical protein